MTNQTLETQQGQYRRGEDSEHHQSASQSGAVTAFFGSVGPWSTLAAGPNAGSVPSKAIQGTKQNKKNKHKQKQKQTNKNKNKRKPPSHCLVFVEGSFMGLHN